MPERNVTLEEVLGAAVRWLEDAGVPYALVGGLTVGVWAEPRATADVDVIVAASPEEVIGALPGHADSASDSTRRRPPPRRADRACAACSVSISAQPARKREKSSSMSSRHWRCLWT